MTWRRLVVALVIAVSSLADARAAAAKIAYYRELPWGACRFVQEQFGATPDPWQEELLVAFANPAIRRISLQACAGPGKTCGEAWCGWYFMATQASLDGRGEEHPNGFATSVTEVNLRDNLWKEFAKWQARSEYLRSAFTWQAERIFQNDNPATWFLAARTWPKSGSADEQGRTFSGLHGQNVLIICDESGTIPPTVLRAGEQALPNTRFGKLLQAGNPISFEGMLYEAANRLAHLWHIIRVTGDPDDPKAWVHNPRVASGAADSPAAWAREQIATYGRENPWVMAYILGQFPPSSINSLLSYEEVMAAMARQLEPHQYEWQQKRIGVDVARFGDDRTVLWPRQGLQSYRPVIMRGARTTEIAARVYVAKQRFGSELELVDDTGHWGHGVIDNLITAGVPAHAVIFHAPALNSRYKNRRAEMWIRMSEAVKGGAALPNLPELIPELTTPTYTFHNGVFQLEEKDQVKKRLGRSPDIADALALTYALPDMPADMVAKLRAQSQGTHVQSEWDPFRSQS